MAITENIIPFLTGGLAGSFVTIAYNKYKNRIQSMECHLVDSEITSKIPVEMDEVIHDNIHYKEFILKNTTNIDVKSVKIIFEFDADAIILKKDTYGKSGKNQIKGKIQKTNEASFVIKNMNRRDQIRFKFDIANVTQNELNVTEADCLGIRIITKDKQKMKSPIKSVIVKKEQLAANR